MPQGPDLEQAVADAVAGVEDPELPVSIADLGMVRAITADDGMVLVRLTPTFLACPALWLVEADVRDRVTGLAGVRGCEVSWQPDGWSAADVTDAGQAGPGRRRPGGAAGRRFGQLPVLRVGRADPDQPVRVGGLPDGGLLPVLPDPGRGAQGQAAAGRCGR